MGQDTKPVTLVGDFMKLIFVCAILLGVLDAKALDSGKYARDVVSMSLHCPAELTALSKIGWVYSAAIKNRGDERILTIIFRAGGFPPSFKSYPVGSLEVVRTLRSGSQIPDAPGGERYECRKSELAND